MKRLGPGVLALLLAAAVRLVVAAVIPLHPDEAFYWEWSRHLAAGYSEHPPMVALLIRVGTSVFGDTPLGVRFATVICGAIATWAVMATARAVADQRSADIAGLTLTALPVAAGAFVLATPDAPLLAFLSLTIFLTTRALTAPAPRVSFAFWIAGGLAVGLAMASKYTAVLVPVAIVLAVAALPSLRHTLRTPGPWSAVVVATVVLLPVLQWNAAHDWVSFRSQIAHGLGRSGGAVWRRELELLGGQVLLGSPILFGLGGGALLWAVRAGGRIARVLAAVALVVAAFFTFAATRSRVEANWPAPAWIALTILIAIVPAGARWAWWRRAGIALALLFSAVLYIQSLVPIAPLRADRDPTARNHGYADLAVAVVREGGGGQARRWVAANRYQDAAELAFLLPGHPEVFSLNLSRRSNQYLLWPGFPDRARIGDDLLLVLFERPEDAPDPALPSLSPFFDSVERGTLVPMYRGASQVGARRLWLLRGWRGAWPPPPR